MSLVCRCAQRQHVRYDDDCLETVLVEALIDPQSLPDTSPDRRRVQREAFFPIGTLDET